MVKYIATILGIAVIALFILRSFERNAANQEVLDLQVAHNEQVLTLTEAQAREDSIYKYRLDSLKVVLQEKSKRIARANARADSLKGILDSQIVALPELTPAACVPWAEALTTCKQVVAQKDSVVKDLTFALNEATVYSDSLGILYERAEERGDSLAENLRLTNEAIDKSECRIIFSVRCPSRKAVAAASIVGTLILVKALN